MTNNLAQIQKDITDTISTKITELEKTGLQLPKNYNAQNALKAAFFTLNETMTRDKKPVLVACDKASIANTLLDMVTQGLSPAKNQCYFIPYGTKLQMQRSYFGTVAVLKRLNDIADVKAEVIHQGDEFEIGSNQDMETVVSKFVPKFENLDNELVGAFAIIKRTDGQLDYTIMTKKQIDKSWAQTRQRNNQVQKNFGDEMAKRTVLNRAAKMYINTSDDSDLLTDAINRTTSNEFDDDNEIRKDVTPKEEKAKDILKEALAEPKEKQVEKQEEATQQTETVEEQQANDNQESEVSDNAKQEELFDHFGMPVDGE